MSVPAVLKALPEYTESKRPAHVQKLVRPEVLCNAIDIAFVIFDKKDLDASERFWQDFGLTTASRTPAHLVMRANGPAPAVIIAKKAATSRYLGCAFVVPDDTDFESLRQRSDAVDLPPSAIPGGGEGVSLVDPDGHALWLIRKWGKVEALEKPRLPLTESMNTLSEIRRVNAGVRSPIRPSLIWRLGHFVLQTTDFPKMAEWYARHLGLIPSDVQFLPDGSPVLAFFRLNHGSTPVDHHSIVLATGIECDYGHSAYEVEDLDSIGQGQQYLNSKGHKHMWGIGRHMIGSQLFDYWFDPDGQEFEHYIDSDKYTADHETQYVPFSSGSIWAWGDDVPASMYPAKSPTTLWKVIKLLRQGRMSISRLRLIDSVMKTRPRPWL